MSVSWATNPVRDFTSSELCVRTRSCLGPLLGLPEEELIVRPVEDAWAPERYATPSETPTVELNVLIGPNGGSSDLAFSLGLDLQETEVRTVYIGTYPGHLFVGESKGDAGRALALATVLAAAQLGRSLFEEANDLWPWEEKGPYEVGPELIIERLRQPVAARPIEQAAEELFRGTKIGDPVPPDHVFPAPPNWYTVFLRRRPERPN